MKNIHVLPTDKPSRIIKGQDNVFILLDTYAPNWFEINLKTTKQNIYITSDEVPKLDEWGINLANNVLFKDKGFTPDEYTKNNCRKIILTTDQDLINDGVQAIDDEFLEWFVKNPSCEEVEVEDVYKTFLNGNKRSVSNFRNKYKIIIPKEEPKQETLEEAAEIFVKNRFTKQICNDESYPDIYASKAAIVESHILFAKWQQEQDSKLYSEEEVRHLMTLAFEQGFKKADVVEAGLEAKETDTEVNWIFLKHKK